MNFRAKNHVCLGAVGFEISWFQLFIYIFAIKFLSFLDFFYRNVCWSCLITFSAVCLLFRQLFVYFFVSWLFTLVSCLFTIWIFAPKTLVCHQSFVKIMLQSWKPHLIVYIFSCLFTFSSAICLLFCQLIVYFGQLFVYNLNFRAKNLGLPSVFCQNNASKLETSPDCLHFQLFVYIFVSYLFTFLSADCLLVSAVCLQFQLFIYNWH